MSINNAKRWLVRLVSVSLMCAAPVLARAADIGELFVISKEPFFAEIPVCNLEPDGPDLKVGIVTDEPLDDDGRKPFTENIQASFDLGKNQEGLINVSVNNRMPDNVSFMVTLLDTKGTTVDARLFSGFFAAIGAPEDFICEQPVVDNAEVELSTEYDISSAFAIDTVTGDSWRNIADMINLAWYNHKYTIERVMVALYKYNNKEVLDIKAGTVYSLPDKLFIPTATYPMTIFQHELPLAAYLDELGKLKVTEKKSGTSSSELKSLRKEFAMLQEQLDLLREQLNNSQELSRLKDYEVEKLRTHLVDTRKRIAVLEKENQELSAKGIMDMLAESITSHPVEWIIAFIVFFSIVLWLAIRATQQDTRRYMSATRHYREKKN